MLEWTGERFIPGVKGDIEIEHLHRYYAAAELVAGLDVLDLACGEGYGSAILARRAKSVIGVDISEQAVRHAREAYSANGVQFEVGRSDAIPLADRSVDAVVCFETIEHVAEQEQERTLAEFARVLRPGGWLCISCPDKHEYADVPGTQNPFHVRELYLHEFIDLLQRHFKHVELYGQRIEHGSVLGPLDRGAARFFSYRQEETGMTRAEGFLRPLYLIGIASNEGCPALPVGTFEPEEPAFFSELRTLNQRIADANDDAAKWKGECNRLQAVFDRIDDLATDLGRRMLPNNGSGSPATGAVAVASATPEEGGREVRLASTIQRLVEGALDFRERLKAAEAALLDSEAARRALQASLNENESATRSVQASLQHEVSTSRYWQARAGELEYFIADLQNSRSWRITAPLRAAGTAARAVRASFTPRRFASGTGRLVYRNLPIGDANRYRLKDWVFESFPGVFGTSAAYKRWQDFRDKGKETHRYSFENVRASSAAIERAAATEGSRQGKVPDAAPGPVSVAQSLLAADGRWEWQDYGLVREGTLRGLQAKQLARDVRPPAVLDFKPNDLPGAISALAFDPVDTPDVSIIVPTYNNLKYTVECLTSLMRSGAKASFEVVLADDASTDCTADRLQKVPHLRVLSSDENKGFLLNVNRALPALHGRHVVLLNNDVQVTPGWLDAMLAAIESADDIGAVGPKILYPSGVLQEAGCALRPDGTAEMIGLNDDPDQPQYNYRRTVDYCSGACLLLKTDVMRNFGGFDPLFAPAYCEDSDLCLQLRKAGLRTVYEPTAVVIHHLSVTTAVQSTSRKLHQVARNLVRLTNKWEGDLERLTDVRLIAFYLPQYHPIPENDQWWGTGFTEWRNVGKAVPNYVGHYQPRVPADLGYYDLRIADVMDQQAELAKRYGLFGFCFYYYWFAGRRMLELPIERLLTTNRPDVPFCLCWANENWTRRWDGQDNEVLMAQYHSYEDDEGVIQDLIRFMRHPNYIRVNGRPLLLVYRVALFPDFARTAEHWRATCRRVGLGEIYLAFVESFDMNAQPVDPARYGCDAAVEFPPHGMGDPKPLDVQILNPAFQGVVNDYREVALRYCQRPAASHVRFRGLMPGWDNTARRQDLSYCFEHSTPGAFQAWAEHAIEETRTTKSGEERIVFVNAWNEWAEGAYLEPDRRFGHTYLEALKNAKDAALLKRRDRYALR